MAALPLKRVGRIVVVGEHRQMARCRPMLEHKSRCRRWSRYSEAPDRTGRTTGSWPCMLGRGTTRRCSLPTCMRCRCLHSSRRRGIGKLHRHRLVSHSTGRQSRTTNPRTSSSESLRSMRCTRKWRRSGGADTGRWSDTGRPRLVRRTVRRTARSTARWRRNTRYRSSARPHRSGCPRTCSN